MRIILLCLLSISMFSCNESIETAKVEETNNNETGEIIDNDVNNPSNGLIYGPYEELAKPSDVRINEASGIAASLYVPDAYWVHNDSGDAANIFLCNPRTGETITSGLVEKAQNKDWEDMSSFRINGKSYLIIGSFGDNTRKRSQYRLYIMEEPAAGG